jgi:hypothetical protein
LPRIVAKEYWLRRTSDAQVKLASEAPLDAATRHHDAGDVLAEVLLQRRPPWHQLEAESVIDHGEPARCQHHPLTKGPGDEFALAGRVMCEAGLSSELGCGGIELSPPQRADEVAREHRTLPLPACQSLAGKVINPTFHRVSNLGSEPAATCRRFAGEELPIEPGGAVGCDLGLNRQIGSRGKRQPFAAAGIFIGAHLDNGAGHRITSELDIRETDMVRPPIDALDDRVGGSRQFVIEPAGNKPAEDWVGRVLTMERKP